jgi:hypothetical protein
VTEPEVIEGEVVDVTEKAVTRYEQPQQAVANVGIFELGVMDDAEYARNIEVIKVGQTRVRSLMRDLLVKDVDFMDFAGSGKDQRVGLLKPGAEKLATFFHLVPEFDVQPITTTFEDGRPDRIDVAVQALAHYRSADGPVVGAGTGSCSSWEVKYHYRNAAPACQACGKDLRLAKDRPEWYCWRKEGGCGATYPADSIKAEGKVENPDPYELLNTITKMATKRAWTDAVIRTLSASNLFTQDAEDMQGQPPPAEATAEAPRAAQGRSKAPASTTADPPTADGQPGRFVGVVNEVPDGIRRLADGRPLLELRFKVDGKQHTAKIAGPVAQEMFDAPVSADDEVAIEGTLALIKWSDDPKKPLKKEVHDVTKAAVKVGGKWHVFGGGASADPPTSGTDSPSESTSGSTSSAASTPTPPTGEPQPKPSDSPTPTASGTDTLDEYPDMRAEAQRIFDPERKQGTPGEKVDAQGTVYNIEWQTAPKTGTRFVLLELTNEDDGLLYRFGYGGTLQELVLTKDGKGFRYHPGDELRCMGTWAKGAFIVASGLMRA